MNATRHAGMLEATRLTRAGQLLEATALIQRTLRGEHPPQRDAEAAGNNKLLTLDGECRVVDDPTATRPAHTGAQPDRPSSERASRASVERTATASTQDFGARLHEQLRRQMREQWREFRLPTPGSEPRPHRTPDVEPEGARFITGAYTNPAGTRSYKLYIPSGYHGQPLPLVVMLHGCTQDPDDFAAGTRMNALAEEHRCFVAYPAQTRAANGSKCWNWFKASDQQRDGGEPSIIAGLTRQIADDHCVDPRRIYVAGLSAGGAMAATMATTYPDLYAAVGIHSGLPHRAAQGMPAAFAAMQGGQRASVTRPMTNAAPVPTIVFHGDRDTTVHPRNGEQVVAHSVPAHTRPGSSAADATAPRGTVHCGQVPDGHVYTHTTYHDASGRPIVEHWLIHGAGHFWSGGSSRGSYTDPKGPDATREMLRFFDAHPQGENRRRDS